MKTVKEISALTGISVRTLHYYDETGLLKPSSKSEAGYRFYDDKAMERLQQILFFREFDIPLKDIKTVMNDPSLDRNDILKMQRKMLVAKKERTERLIASIDDILKGDNKMDFEVFSKSEIEELCRSMTERMPQFLQQSITKEFGGMEQWQQHYIESAAKPEVQGVYQKMVEWYGDKESALSAMKNPPSEEICHAFLTREDLILKKLIAKKDEPIDSFTVRETVAEYGFVMKQFYQVKNENELMLSVASCYRRDKTAEDTDRKYGSGASDFFAAAIESFYKI